MYNTPCIVENEWQSYVPSFVGIQQNLHVVLIMDCTNKNFSINCESNPAFFKQCSVLWLDGWSRESMVQVSNFSVFLVHFTRNNNK